MRLLVVSQYFWPENFRVNDLVHALHQRGHAVTVLTGLPNYPEGTVFAEFAAAPESYARYGEVNVVRVPLVPRATGRARLVLNYASFALTAGILGAWKLRGHDFDAIFVYQPSPITSCIPALVIGRLKRAPVTLWTLDLWPDTLAAVGVLRSRRAMAIVGRLVSAIYKRCALVLGQSKGFEANVTRLSGDPSRFRYFPQWSEEIFYEAGPAVEPAPEIRPVAGGFTVLFAGNVGEAQDFPAILEAAERLKHRSDIRWVVVGDGRAAAWVAEEIDRRGLNDSVRLLGRHPIERMPAFFAGADALIVSLRRDPVFAQTIPGKLQSYLAAGRPILAMLDGEGARVVQESGAGYTAAAGDGAGLAAIVERMAALAPEERLLLGQRGAEYARREFGRERLLSQLEDWLQESIMTARGAS